MRNLVALLSAIVMICAACGVYTATYSNYDHSVDFKQYKTFAWLPDSGMDKSSDSTRVASLDNDIIRNNAKNYISQVLNDRGYKVQTDTPDVLMELVLINKKMERIVSYPTYYVAPYYYYNRRYYPYYYPRYDHYTYYGWGWHMHYWGYNTTYKETYIKGTIVINMYDRKLKKLVWTGSAEGDIYDPYYAQKDIHPAIQRIMRSFPIKAQE